MGDDFSDDGWEGVESQDDEVDNVIDGSGEGSALGDDIARKRRPNPHQYHTNLWSCYRRAKGKKHDELKKTLFRKYPDRNRKFWLDVAAEWEGIQDFKTDWKGRAKELRAWALENVPEEIVLEKGLSYDRKKHVWKIFKEYQTKNLMEFREKIAKKFCEKIAKEVFKGSEYWKKEAETFRQSGGQKWIGTFISFCQMD